MSGMTPEEGSILVSPCLGVSLSLRLVVEDWAVCSESMVMVVVLLLYSNNNNNIHNDNTAIVPFKKDKKRAVANLMHNLHLPPIENGHCAYVPCGAYGQCFGVLVWRLKPLNVSAYVHGEETQVSPVWNACSA